MVATLVTGSAGFIGMHVADALLSRGDRVIGIDNLNDYYDPRLKYARLERLSERHGRAFHFERVDFADRHDLDAVLSAHRFDRILHLGAQAGVRYSIDNPHAYVQSNLVGHLNLLEIARARRVEHLVYASSSSVYGGSQSSPFCVEDRVERPLSLYAATKKADELMSESYAHLYRLPQTGLRFFTVYGPWGRPDMVMWIFARAIIAGSPLSLFNHGEMERDFTYIDDVVAGILAALDHPPVDNGHEKPGGSIGPHSLYNIGNNRAERLGRVIDLLESEIGRPAIRRHLPMQPGDVSSTRADIAPIQKQFGFVPQTTIDEGIPKFVRWYRDFHGLEDRHTISPTGLPTRAAAPAPHVMAD